MMWTDFNDAPQQAAPQAALPAWAAHDSFDREEVKTSLLRQLESVLGYLYPNGFADPKGGTFYIGNASGDAGESLNVVLTGERAGLWHDFATADGGDIFDLWQAARGLPSFRETLRDAALYSGAAATTPRRMPKRKQPSGGEAWGQAVATYRYTDTRGSIVAEVERFEWLAEDGKRAKAFRPWDVATRRHRAPETRPLYNLPNIFSAPEIVVVEGEKAADALIAQNIDATTAMGGASAPLDKTDWSVMRGRSVVIWPDHDAAGKAYAERLKAYLEEQGAAGVTVLQIPAGRPEKWDAADAESEDLGALIRAMRAAPVNDADMPRRRFEFISIADLEYRDPEYLVDGLIETESLGLVFSDPGVGKSFFAVDLLSCVASGHPFHGHDVLQGTAFLIAGEGKNGLKRRFTAWEKHNNTPLSGCPLFISTVAAQFLDTDHATEVAKACDDLSVSNGIPRLIVIDTLARNFGPGDENSTMDMSKFVASVDRLKERYPGCTIIIIHHTGHSDKQRSRGSMVLNGALDVEYRITKEDGVLSVENTKMKDGPQPDPKYFLLESVEIGTSRKGDPVTSAVLVEANGKIQSNEKLKLKPIASEYWKYIQAYFCEPESYRIFPPMADMPPMKTAILSKVRAWCNSAVGDSEDDYQAKKKRWQRAVKELRDVGLIGVWEDKLWLV